MWEASNCFLPAVRESALMWSVWVNNGVLAGSLRDSVMSLSQWSENTQRMAWIIYDTSLCLCLLSAAHAHTRTHARTHTRTHTHTHTHSARGIAALKDFLTVTLCCLFLILFARVFKPCQYKHSNKGCGKAQTSACAPCSVRMQKAVSHRQQDQTELSFASSCTWTK